MDGAGMSKTVAFLRSGRPEAQIKRVADFEVAAHIPHVVCADGFRFSVQAGELLYSTPRQNRGPWTHAEVGFPSAIPEPWDEWREYVEDPNDPTGTVYAYVPVETIEALIALHGGEK